MTMTHARQPSFLKTLLIPGAIIGAGLIAIGVTQDRNAVEKIVTALLMPSGWLWILMLTLSLQLWMQKQTNTSGRTGAMAATVCWLLYSAAGNGFIADKISRSLEAKYLSIDPLKEEPVDVVIVLGGGCGLGANGRLQGNVSGDRMILAAQLYHQKITSKFICTGQRIATMNSSGVDPAEASRDVLLKLGVPETAIEISEGRNTAEEMLSLSRRFQNTQPRIGVLTSAWHLPRAMRLAERNGLHPIPIPADFRSAANVEAITTGQIVENMIPSGYNLAVTCASAKEYLGMFAGR